MRKIIYIVVLCLFACTNTSKKGTEIIPEANEQGVQTIDLSTPKFSNDKMLLSDLVEEVEYIKLESPDEALVKEGITRIDDDYIYILSEVIYLFSRRDGKFIRKIGKIGQGPGEFRLAVNFNIAQGKVYIRPNWLRKILVYGVETGDFLGEISCTGASKGIYIHPNQAITLLRNRPPYKEQYSFMNINHSGDTLIFKSPEIVLSDEIVRKKHGAHLPWIPAFWEANGEFNLYDSMTDTVYAVSGNGYRPRFHISRGNYGMDAEKYFSTEWGRTTSEKGWKDYIKPVGFIESSQYIYINLDYKDTSKGSHWARYDKRDGEVKWWRNKIPEERIKLFGKDVATNSFYNDFDGGRNTLFQVNDKHAATYITQTHINGELTAEHFASITPLHPDKQARMKQLIDEMDEEDNPILVIYKLK